MAPAVERGDCAKFGDALYEYGVVAGNCFAPVQGGPFNGPVLTELVARMRALGARGVGQRSWGPTVFAVMPNDAEAASFARAIADDEVHHPARHAQHALDPGKPRRRFVKARRIGELDRMND